MREECLHSPLHYLRRWHRHRHGRAGRRVLVEESASAMELALVWRQRHNPLTQDDAPPEMHSSAPTTNRCRGRMRRCPRGIRSSNTPC